MGFLKTLFDANEREIARLRRTVAATNAFEAEISALSDAELQAKTPAFRERLAAGAALDDMLPEVFAVCREAGKRILNMRHFDVQIMGGQVLHEGKVAEMKTGEGKTLVATLAVYANALLGRGVHVVTVNDYLARRDAEWMAPLYNFLGLTIGVIQHDLQPPQRREAYNADITYVTNNEVGFDYLRDNMAWQLEDMVQRELYYAIVDEVDSILIDEARTPLIISGQGQDATELYGKFAQIIPRLIKDEDFTVDEKAHAVPITEKGVAKVEKMLGIQNLYDQRNLELTHQLNAALKAWNLFHNDQQYIVKDGEVIIVDEFTGRLMYGRRYSDGIHQAIEAKEGLKVRSEDQTLATITFQNYFRLYEKLAGMTGTAKTEEREFRDIYGLDVVVIPTNRPVARDDKGDIVYKTREREVRSGRRRDHRRARAGAARCWSARARSRRANGSRRLLAPARRRVPGAQREVPRDGSRDHQGRGPVRRGHDRDQHGRPRRRHQARRRRRPSSAGCTSSAPSATNRAASTTSCAAAPAARATPARRASTSRSKTSSCGSSARDRIQSIMNAVGFTDDTPIEAKIISRSIERAQIEGRKPQLRDPQAGSRIRRRHEQAARGDLRRAPQGAPAASRCATSCCRRCATRSSRPSTRTRPRTCTPPNGISHEILSELELIFPIRTKLGVEDLEKLDRERA